MVDEVNCPEGQPFETMVATIKTENEGQLIVLFNNFIGLNNN